MTTMDTRGERIDVLRSRYASAATLVPHALDWWAQRVRPSIKWTGPSTFLTVVVDREAWKVQSLDVETGTRSDLLGATEIAALIDDDLGPANSAYRVRLESDGVHVRGSRSCWFVPFDSDVRPCGEPATGVVSHDGRRRVFADEGDLWLWEFETESARRLTVDGTPADAYALHGSAGRDISLHRYLDKGLETVAIWSPDDSWIATHRVRERGVAQLTWVDSANGRTHRPATHTKPYSLPGDEAVPLADLVLLKVDEPGVSITAPTSFEVPYRAREGDGWGSWSSPQTFDLLLTSRDWHSSEVWRTSTATRRAERIYEAQSEAWSEWGPYPARPPLLRAVGADELVAYDGDHWQGALKLVALSDPAVTKWLGSADWLPEGIHQIDLDRRRVLVTLTDWEHEPYRARIAWLRLDGSAPDLWDDDGLHHEVLSVSPDGSYIVDIASSTNVPPKVSVVSTDGATARTLLDTTDVVIDSMPTVERLEFLAADGVTKLVGTLYLPAGRSADDRHPLLDHMYPGPQVGRTFPGHWATRPGEELALAQLGMAVLTLDGRGTPGRGSGFHRLQYQNTQTAGFIEDHLAAIEQLGDRYPSIDTSRVAAMGHSGGAFAAFRALALHPEVFTCAVAASGDHDQTAYMSQWLEHWHAADASTYEGISNIPLAPQVDRPLMLVHGEADDNVFAVLTMRLADALMDANKDFDLLIVPGAEHSFTGRVGYVTRRQWDFLVEHLQIGSVPRGFRLPEPHSWYFERFI